MRAACPLLSLLGGALCVFAGLRGVSAGTSNLDTTHGIRVGVVGSPAASFGQSRTTPGAASATMYRARLAPVPIDLTMQATVAGTGTVSATLNGAKLSLTGSFEGLKSPATIARIHRSPARGVRGPEVFSLNVTPSTSGTVSGTVDLTPAQLADLQKGLLYVQLHSEKAPDGNLWGWLLRQEKR